MEVVAASPGTAGGVPPFHDHDVREWSRIDSLTGVLERARLETDHWTANTATSCHKYGKVVDSRARTNADGALQQQARRQLEVFQSHIPGGHLQVIKTQTVSSSRWSSSNRTAEIQELPVKDFENLQLSVNPLDLSSQKSKANVGRGVGRRPPSRPRAKEDSLRTAQQNLHRVSRLCHQIHDQAVKQTIRRHNELNGHQSLTRTKSTSSEDLHLEDKSTKSIEDLEDLEQLQSWRRSSKLRRSLQYPKQAKAPTTKPVDLPENSGSVRKIREELEKGRRLSTALRGNNVDLEALDQILQTISSSSSNQSDKLDPEENQDDLETKKQKRNSFVTVETLQEVRGRLRRTSTPTEDVYKVNKEEEETDDGIVTEEANEMPVTEKSTRVRSYVYGMEAMLNNKKPILGTGSLESRSKLLNGGTNLRNEDWYNRRKSYGFEQVHNHAESANPISLRSKGRVESSTDSGICRSSEIVIVPTTTKNDNNLNNCDESNTFTSVKKISSIFDQNFSKDLRSTTITIPIVSKPNNSNFVDVSWDDVPEKEAKRHSIAVDESKYVTSHDDNNKFRRTSLAINPTLEDPTNPNRKSKKVEFCKTEVHFAAESGRVNIVETDEKPPPTNNFRRRRRNSGPLIVTDDFERNGLPVLHFGDTSYEKVLLGVTESENNADSASEEIVQSIHPSISCGTVTVNTTSNPVEIQEEEKKESVENVKGILKNKPIKPTPYHLGEEPFLNNSNSDSDSGKWGIRLKPVQKNEPPYWKSTVTLHNTVYGQEQETEEQPEFQKLLRNLRPTAGNRPDLINDQRNEENFSSVKFVTSSDNRRSWSVADKIRLNEENKVYSTKVNFGDGGAAVVENDRFGHKEQTSSWKKENPVKDDSSEPARYTFGIENSLSNSASYENEQDERSKSYKIKVKDSQYSPTITHKSSSFAKRSDLRTASASESLSSPSLVGRSSKLDLATKKYEMNSKETEFLNVTDVKLHQKLATNEVVLRQPKKSEMTYFGVNVSPKPTKKNPQPVIKKETKLTEKPDLLQHMKTDSLNSRTRLRSPEKQRSPSSRARLHSPEKNSSPCSRIRHRSPEKESSPIYENVPKSKSRYGREFDKDILDELTKAADQILQAVNGFTDDDCQNKHSGDDRNVKEPLDTITESKSWTQDKKTRKTTTKQSSTRTKLKHTSSTSSVESLSKEKKLNQSKKPLQTTQIKKKTVNNESSTTNTTRANTKARRLQRASSREALLQSHGSSSEDLGTNVEVPHRKPRQIKKTKLTQLTVTNGPEIKNKTPPNAPRRRRDESKERTEHLQEIRHKTAVSTIRSTAEKSSRDRSKSRTEESKKRIPQKKESSRGLSSKSEPKKTVSSREISNHRITTANIKKCHRADGGSKH